VRCRPKLDHAAEYAARLGFAPGMNRNLPKGYHPAPQRARSRSGAHALASAPLRRHPGTHCADPNRHEGDRATRPILGTLALPTGGTLSAYRPMRHLRTDKCCNPPSWSLRPGKPAEEITPSSREVALLVQRHGYFHLSGCAAQPHMTTASDQTRRAQPKPSKWVTAISCQRLPGSRETEIPRPHIPVCTR
jgi:hypothetical protein